MKLSHGASSQPRLEPGLSRNASSLRPGSISGEGKSQGFWGPGGSDEGVWEQQQLRAPQNKARGWTPRAEERREGGPPGGWREQRHQGGGLSTPRRHTGPTAAPFPLGDPGLPSPCLACHPAHHPKSLRAVPCGWALPWGGRRLRQTGCQGREGRAESAGRGPREAWGWRAGVLQGGRRYAGLGEL